jgi:hypothetical protein
MHYTGRKHNVIRILPRRISFSVFHVVAETFHVGGGDEEDHQGLQTSLNRAFIGVGICWGEVTRVVPRQEFNASPRSESGQSAKTGSALSMPRLC